MLSIILNNTQLDLTPTETALLLGSLRYSYNAVNEESKLSKYADVEPDSHASEALECLIRTKAIYSKLILAIANN